MLSLRRLRLRQLQTVARSAASGSATSSNGVRNAVGARANSTSTSSSADNALNNGGADVLVTPSILKPRKDSALPGQPKPKGPDATASSSTPKEETPKPEKKPRPKKPTSNPNYYASRARDSSNKLPKKRLRGILRRVLPAYDEALKIINKDSRKIKQEINELEKKIGETVVEAKEKRGELERVVKEEGVKPGDCVRELRDTQVGEEGEVQEVVRTEVVNEKVYQAKKAFLEVDTRLEKLREKMSILEVQSEVNLPSVRWEVANAMGNIHKPVHRHLLEQRWREDGKLDLLMERIYQMNVVPDILPAIHPTIDLDVTINLPTSRLLRSRKRVFLTEPGRFVLPEQTLKPPTLFPHPYHTDTRLYTLLMIDPDVPNPNPENPGQGSFTTYLHWMKPNIPLSASNVSGLLGSLNGYHTNSESTVFTSKAIKGLNTHTRYIPPHPQKGSPYHRYTILLLLQPPKDPLGLGAEGRGYSRNVEWEAVERAKLKPEGTKDTKKKEGDISSLVTTSKFLPIPIVPDSERLGFDVRAFCKRWGLYIGSTRVSEKVRSSASGGPEIPGATTHSLGGRSIPRGAEFKDIRRNDGGSKGWGPQGRAVVDSAKGIRVPEYTEPLTKSSLGSGSGSGVGSSSASQSVTQAQTQVGSLRKDRPRYAGGAVHMFREVWDETVGGIYENWFGKQEPRYGLPPKYNPYKELKTKKRYVLQGKGQGLGGEGKGKAASTVAAGEPAPAPSVAEKEV
ncbi:hypothetical protein D9758_007327 [Tetrapyrgos nigripes]|uniref:PEBP-like protein n=1 Tax=Tetrapyrgos nigripes TaxID=182062 RepID=A0A8H5GBA9_9AGAR|nr:hypothetical protein D9758_007327 [Tetrapyrgos nigripes]